MLHPSEVCSAHTFTSSIVVGLELSSILAVLSEGSSVLGKDIRVKMPEYPRPQGVRDFFPFAVVEEVSRSCLFPGARSLATG